ncbi:hypothetical protein LTR66_013619 [Elasticomyces elasticus]|nr:hypothetical protein LTR66_013619 [Elasticomyces elasticus]
MDLTQYQLGDVIPFHFIWYIVFASYFASLIGTTLTVELLHRRRTGSGWFSQIQLGLCAIAMGLIGIWCMHFIGNRAIVLGDGNEKFQLYYSPRFTVLSLILPIICLYGAFFVAELPHGNVTRRNISLVATGFVAGISIVGMHYTGNLGITNYNLDYSNRFIVGACIVATVDCIITLTLFFVLREKWINHFTRRFFCAALLAVAVSGMHWVASIGCKYRLKELDNSSLPQGRNTNVIIAGVLCALTSFICFGIMLLTRQRQKQLADRAQQVMLACAVFDPEGKIMVTHEGLLPCAKITKQYNQRSFDYEFNTAHPAFQWIFRITHNWAGVSDLIPGMKSHLRSQITGKDNSRPSSPASSIYEDETYTDYSVIFRESFCVAAAELAESLHEPLGDLGILYDTILETGTLKATTGRARRRLLSVYGHSSRDLEGGVPQVSAFGKGQLLVLVRQASREDVSRLVNVGFKFASLNLVGGIIARNLQVPLSTIREHVDEIRNYSQTINQKPEAGTFFACFAILAKPSHRGFEVLVRKDRQDHLPDIHLCDGELSDWQNSFLKRMDGMSVASFAHFVGSINDKKEGYSDLEKDFAKLLAERITAMAKEIPEPWFRQAVFSSTPVTACYTNPISKKPLKANIFPFVVMPDVHAVTAKNCENLLYTPLSFFNSRQRTYVGSPDHNLLVREIHREFSPIIARLRGSTNNTVGSRKSSVVDSSTRSTKTRRPLFRLKSSPSPNGKSGGQPDNSSQHELVKTSSDLSTAHAWGGILTTSETVVENSNKSGTNVEMLDYGIKAEVVADREEKTFVDELFAVTKARFQFHKS